VKPLVSTRAIVGCSVCFIADGRTFHFDRMVKYSGTCCGYTVTGGLAQSMASCSGINFGLMKNFRGIDITNTCQYFLIEECNFYMTP
jgi:hypothetical protein